MQQAKLLVTRNRDEGWRERGGMACLHLQAVEEVGGRR